MVLLESFWGLDGPLYKKIDLGFGLQEQTDIPLSPQTASWQHPPAVCAKARTKQPTSALPAFLHISEDPCDSRSKFSLKAQAKHSQMSLMTLHAGLATKLLWSWEMLHFKADGLFISRLTWNSSDLGFRVEERPYFLQQWKRQTEMTLFGFTKHLDKLYCSMLGLLGVHQIFFLVRPSAGEHSYCVDLCSFLLDSSTRVLGSRQACWGMAGRWKAQQPVGCVAACPKFSQDLPQTLCSLHVLLLSNSDLSP